MASLESSILDALFEINTPIRRALFFSYKFDVDFFAEEMVPRLRQLGCFNPLVVIDAKTYQELKKSAFPEQLREVNLVRYSAGRLFHPKLFIVAGTGMFRCVVGSANMTQRAFQDNKEIFSLLSENNADSAGLIEFLGLVADEMSGHTRALDLIHDIVSEIKAASRLNSQDSHVRFVWNGVGKSKLINLLNGKVEKHGWTRAVILSPYFEAPDSFNTGLLKRWLKAKMKIDLYLPFEQSRTRVPRDQLISLEKQFPGRLRLFGMRTEGKTLHAKLICVMDRSKALMLTGSANFTAAALLGKNVEANLLFEMRRQDVEAYLKRLLARSKQIGGEDLGKPEPEPEAGDSPMTGFLLNASLQMEEDLVVIIFNQPTKELLAKIYDIIIEINGKRVDWHEDNQLVDRIKVPNASGILRTENKEWQLGKVHISNSRRTVEDWALVEYPPEMLETAGTQIEQPANLESFVEEILVPRNYALGSRQSKRTPEHKAGFNSENPNLVDVEAPLDKAFRMSRSIINYFQKLMTDPHTVYRWKGNWTRLSEIVHRELDSNGATETALISREMLKCLEHCLGDSGENLQGWILQNQDLLASIRTLYALAQMTPDLEYPIVNKLVTVAQ